MGIVYFIRHGQRFPTKNFPFFKSAFGEEPVVPGQLTAIGRTRMRNLGTTFKDVPILRAKFSAAQRCQDSLTEFLKGAGSSVQPGPFGDRNFEDFQEITSNCDIPLVTSAIESTIRNERALDAVVDKYLPGLEAGFLRNAAAVALIDALAILDDRGVQKMTNDVAQLNLDCAVGLALGLRAFFEEPIRKTIREAFDNNDGHTVALVSDVHLLFVLQRVAPLLVVERPPFGSVLKLTTKEDCVVLEYSNRNVEIPLAEFQRKIELDVPLAHF